MNRISKPKPILLLAAVMLLTTAAPSMAIPAFARKYGTSCQTCHIAYPKLNAFGESFRQLGYHMPGETEGQIKQPDVPLGAPAYKRVWPNAVWPSGIPSHVPVAVVTEFLVQTRSQLEETEEGESERELTQNDFLFPSEAALVAAGSGGDHMAFFGEIGFEQEVEDGVVDQEAGVEHIDIRFMRMLHNSTALNLKIGAFQPELVSTFDHARRLTIANYDSMFSVQTLALGGANAVGGGHGHGGGGGLALPAIARGFELFGTFRHRLQYAVGLVNGIEPGQETFDANSRKDTYARISYKWGGLAPDGSNAATYTTSAKNWREQSLRLGVFTYQGDGTDVFQSLAHDEEEAGGHADLVSHLRAFPAPHEEEPEAAFLEPEDYSRVGFDFNVFYKDLNVFGAYVRGRDDLRVFAADPDNPEHPGAELADEAGSFTYRSWFLEADLVLHYPWLHGAARYETVDLPAPGIESWERGTLSLTGLIRANVKSTLEYTWDLNDSQNYFLWLSFGMAF